MQTSSLKESAEVTRGGGGASSYFITLSRSPASTTTEFPAANSLTGGDSPEDIGENIRGLLLAEDGHVAEVLKGALTHSVLTHLQHRTVRSLRFTTIVADPAPDPYVFFLGLPDPYIIKQKE